MCLPFVSKPVEANGAAPGKSGYGPVLWKACVKFGLYIAVGADPVELDIPIPFTPVDPITPSRVRQNLDFMHIEKREASRKLSSTKDESIESTIESTHIRIKESNVTSHNKNATIPESEETFKDGRPEDTLEPWKTQRRRGFKQGKRNTAPEHTALKTKIT
ncbi:unnamed protein product [Callosobruchus maculatus]|uniref:Uncharacterized protein n=1 Tax=Callosobruchus maculatus TaxID=64391 RepID=A0A653BHD8_CALMS|nr:unnamed protein product [Callosobruchus maculatus]